MSAESDEAATSRSTSTAGAVGTAAVVTASADTEGSGVADVPGVGAGALPLGEAVAGADVVGDAVVEEVGEAEGDTDGTGEVGIGVADGAGDGVVSASAADDHGPSPSARMTAAMRRMRIPSAFESATRRSVTGRLAEERAVVWS